MTGHASTAGGDLVVEGDVLHFRPNPLARNLRQGRSGVVGVAVGQLSEAFRDPATLPLLDAMSEVLGAAGLGLLLMADDDGLLNTALVPERLALATDLLICARTHPTRSWLVRTHLSVPDH